MLLHVHVRIFGGVAHARLRRQVDHAFRLVGGERRLHRRAVGQVRLHVDVVRVVDETRQPRLLEGDVVVVVQVVETDDRIAPRQQYLGHVRTDETGGTGDQNLHCRALRCRGRGCGF